MLAFIALLFFIYPIGKSSISVLSGYSAKAACSCVFVAERELQTVIDEELAAYNAFIEVSIDESGKKAIANAAGTERIAVYREGLGCSLLPEGQTEAADVAGFEPVALPLDNPDSLQWPFGSMDTLPYPSKVNKEKLDAAVEKIFTESNPELLQNTRAALVVYQDKIIAERYAEGFDKNTPLLGWSMTKSVTNALAGILVGKKANPTRLAG